MVEKAKELCEDLLANVREDYEQFKSRPPRQYGDRPNHQGYQGGYNGNGHHHHHGGHGGGGGGGGGGNHNYGNPSASGAGSAVSPTTPGGGAAQANDYAAQYAQYYGGADPYAAYGGYQAYVAPPAGLLIKSFY
jgi:hypothetical protein